MNILSNIAITAPIAAVLAQMTVGDISPMETESRLTVIMQAEIERERQEQYQRSMEMLEALRLLLDEGQA